MAKKQSKNKEEVSNKKTSQKTVLNDVTTPEKKTGKAGTSENINGDNKTELEQKAEQLEKDLIEARDKHLRLIAEYDNYRKRTLKEKMELSKTAGEKVLTGVLPVIDDFERALQHLDKASDLQAVKDGITLIYNKFISFLSQQGVKEIETVSQDFNADLHNAITKIPAPSDDLKGKILDCVQKGYILEDKVIRYPQVVVGE